MRDQAERSGAREPANEPDALVVVGDVLRKMSVVVRYNVSIELTLLQELAQASETTGIFFHLVCKRYFKI